MASDSLESNLTKATYGFHSKEDYKRKREGLQAEEAIANLRKKVGGGGAAGSSSAGAGEEKKKKKKKKQPSALSFDDDLDGEGEPSPSMQPKKMGKCQDEDVSFPAKNTQEKQEAAVQQEQALRDYLVLQEKAKKEDVTLSYAFRSETTQRELPNAVARGSVTVTRGSTAEEVAHAVARDVEKRGGKFEAVECAGVREERDVLLAAGTDLARFVIPPAITLVELGMKRWAEDTPLFEDFKAGIIVTERRWYEQVRHVYPYSAWTVFDVHTTYSHKEYLANRDTRSTAGVDCPTNTNGNVVTQRTGR